MKVTSYFSQAAAKAGLVEHSLSQGPSDDQGATGLSRTALCFIFNRHSVPGGAPLVRCQRPGRAGATEDWEAGAEGTGWAVLALMTQAV